MIFLKPTFSGVFIWDNLCFRLRYINLFLLGDLFHEKYSIWLLTTIAGVSELWLRSAPTKLTIQNSNKEQESSILLNLLFEFVIIIRCRLPDNLVFELTVWWKLHQKVIEIVCFIRYFQAQVQQLNLQVQ